MRTVLITGGSRGIGKAISKKFHENGYNIIAPGRQDLDLNNMESIEHYVKSHKDQYFDVIINNAGCNDINLIEDLVDSEMNNMINVNLVAPMRLLRGFVGKMKEKNYGRIVNIGSIWGVVSKEGRVVYSATKHAIHGITSTLAVELAEYNILVNTVCPGYTLTELTSKNNTEEQIKEISLDIPMGRMARPEEIAEVVYFFASENNTYATGQQITVDGGYSSK